MLCTGCGNEIDSTPCPICSEGRAWESKEKKAELQTYFCSACGNEVVGESECPVCRAGRARIKPGHDEVERRLCPGCGNEVEDPKHCPICRSGRFTGKGPLTDPNAGPCCPRCEDPLQDEDWEGVAVGLCPTCNGCFFPMGGLETTLNKLRETSEAADLPTVLREFRDRFTRKLPVSLRYKDCPECGTVMTRRNYAGVSGIIIDVCGLHGTWVDQAAFGELSDFISRGGELLSDR